MLKYQVDKNYTIEIRPELEQALKRTAESKNSAAIKVAPPIIDPNYTDNSYRRKTPVQPFTSLEDIERIKQYFLTTKGHGNTQIRNYAYFVLSLNTMRRCGDIVSLRIGDVLNEDGSFKTHLIINHEQKTEKRSTTFLNSNVIEALALYFNTLKEYKNSDWLFPVPGKPEQHMSVDGMRRMLQRTVKALGIDMKVGTHSLRKTMPYHIISNASSVEDEVAASQLLNHRNVKTTYSYAGRTQDKLDDVVKRNML